jgi:hypothetical protein
LVETYTKMAPGSGAPPRKELVKKPKGGEEVVKKPKGDRLQKCARKSDFCTSDDRN